MSTKSFWICVVLGATLFAVVVGTQGLGVWNWLLAVVLALCPLVTAWAAFKSRRLQKDATAAARAAGRGAP